MAERKPAPDQPEISAADLVRAHGERGLAATRLPGREILLGRKPMPEDKRDHPMSKHLTDEQISDAQLDMSLRDLLAQGFFSNWKQVLAFWRWARPKKPKPPKARRFVLYDDAVQLDQGATGHCVGFAWSQWHNSPPVIGTYVNADGHNVYYECKVIDGQPLQENGSWTRSGAQAMKNRGRLDEYVFAGSVEEIIAWLLNHGPVAVGSDWDGPMFDPDVSGYLRPDGNSEGGHEWLLIGYDDGGIDYVDTEPYFVMQNSWGLNWGVQVVKLPSENRLTTILVPGGRAKITVREFKQLFARDGDAAAALELA